MIPARGADENVSAVAGTPRTPPSLESTGLPVLGSQALVQDRQVAAAIVTDHTSEITRSLERSAMLTGTIERDFRAVRAEVDALTSNAVQNAQDLVRVIRDGMREGIDQAVREASPPPGSMREGLRQGYFEGRGEPVPDAEAPEEGLAPPASPGRGGGRREAPRGPRRLFGDPATGEEHHAQGGGVAPNAISRMTYDQGLRVGSNIAELREHAAAGVNRWLSERTPTAPYVQNDDGTFSYGIGHPMEGQPVGPRMQGHATSAMAQFARSESRRGRVTEAVNAFGEGGGLSGALGVLTKRAGPIGLAIGVGSQIANQMESQREENRFYQNIQGGSNFAGFGERARERLFGLTGIGTMGQGQSRELFRSVSETGLQGDDRSRALDFATEQFRKTGMDVSVSMDLIRTSIANGVTDFAALNESLDAVSKSAREGGRNVGEAQKAFAQTFAQVSTQLTNTGAAPAVAAALREGTEGQGRALSSLDYSGTLNMQGLTMQASALGINPLTYRAQVGSGTGAGLRLLGRGIQTQVDQVAQSIITPQQRTQAQQMASGMDLPNGKLTPGQADQIGRQLGVNPEALMYSLQARGITGVTPANVYEYAGKLALGGVNLREGFNEQAERRDNGGLRANQVGRLGNRDLQAGQELTTGQTGALERNLGYTSRMRAMRYGGVKETPGLGKEARDALQTYEQRVEKTGRRSGAIEGLLRKGAISDDSKFLVQTRDGQRQVSLSEAVKDYRDQLETGRATVLSGSQAGRTVGDITGVTTTADAPSETRKAKSGTKDFKAPQGSVMIDLSPEAKRVFRVVSGGGAYIGDAGASATAPVAFPPLSDLEGAGGG